MGQLATAAGQAGLRRSRPFAGRAEPMGPADRFIPRHNADHLTENNMVAHADHYDLVGRTSKEVRK
jgi:hypothetical protein